MKKFSHFSVLVNNKNKTVILRISFTLIYCMFNLTGIKGGENRYINFADVPCGIQQPLPPPPTLFSVLFRSAKIIPGDEPAYPGEFPWIVSFRWNNNGEHFCAGSIISKRYILSAAHCFTKFISQNQEPSSPPYPYRWMEVTLGAVNLDESAQNKHFNVDQIWVHPKFNLSNYSNDVAVVQLEEEISWSPYKQPVCLPLSADFEDNEIKNNYENPNTMTIAGWGSTKMGPGPTNIMRKANIDSFYKNDECQLAYSNLEPRKRVEIVKEHLCAGGRSKNKIKEESADACYGDSGGPLMLNVNSLDEAKISIGQTIKDKTATYSLSATVAVGIISAGGSGCAKYPGIYARISKYIQWISTIVPQSLQMSDSGQLTNENSVVISGSI